MSYDYLKKAYHSHKHRYPDQPRDGSWYDSDYKAKCALAEKLGDVGLRRWCVEMIGVSGYGMTSDFERIDTLFRYIKGGNYAKK